MTDKLNPDILEATQIIFDHCEKDCDTKRRYMLPVWKRAEFYWNDVQDLFWREDLWDWATFEEEEGESPINAIRDSNKIVNIYRAYGESIIAAATIGNLSIRFFPRNADDPADLDKSRTYSNISDLIQVRNNIKDLRRKAFTIRWNQGLVASYVDYELDAKKYGSYKRDVVADKTAIIKTTICPNEECEYEAPSERLSTPEQLDEEAVQPIQTEPELCPDCGEELKTQQQEEVTPEVTGKEEVPFGCSIIRLFSPLQIAVPFYATRADEVNYVILKSEVHYGVARSMFPDNVDEINAGNVDPTESEERNQADVHGTMPSSNLVTISWLWAKPSLYNILAKDAKMSASALLQKYPDGVKIITIDKKPIKCEPVDMDKHWTFYESSMDTHIYCRALGNGLIPIQDMENDLTFFEMDTIRHEVGEVYFDSRIIDPKVMRKQEAKAGNKYPVQNIAGNKAISDYFYQSNRAQLSQAVDMFHERLETRGQLISSAFPSVFGGQFEGGSKTLGVYELSRAQALQRVTIPTNEIDDFLAKTVYKATVLYDENMQNDETHSLEEGNNYRNITLHKSSPEGKVSRVMAMKSEQFPTTWEQKRAFVMELLDKNLDPINATIFASENMSLMGRIIGIPELKVPGDADRDKQLHEIREMLLQPPNPPQIDLAQFGITDPSMLQPEMVESLGMDPMQFNPQMLQETASIEPDWDVDNQDVAIATIIAWAVSQEGILAKRQNPEGYKNVILQLRARQEYAQQQKAAQAQVDAEFEEQNSDAPPQKEKEKVQ